MLINACFILIVETGKEGAHVHLFNIVCGKYGLLHLYAGSDCIRPCKILGFKGFPDLFL